MNNLKELSELAWQGKLDTKFEHHPVHTFYEGSTELAEDLLGIKGIAGMYIVDTKDEKPSQPKEKTNKTAKSKEKSPNKEN